MQKIERAPQSERNLETQFPGQPNERTPDLPHTTPTGHRSLDNECCFNDASMHRPTLLPSVVSLPVSLLARMIDSRQLFP